MTFEVGQEVLWTFPRRSEPRKAVLTEKRDEGWWLIRLDEGQRYAHENEMSFPEGKKKSEGQ